MKLTNKQRQELQAIKYLIPEWCEFQPITDDDLKTFFDWSDKGIKYELKPMEMSGLAALHYGKQYRDLHITTYREDIADGILAKWQLINDMPDSVQPWLRIALKGSGPGKHVYKMWKDLDGS